MRVPRETLHEEIWAEPMTTVAARYEVSASFLARVCERLNVPRPPRGYWAQLSVGQSPKRLSLPQAGPGAELDWVRGNDVYAGPRRVPHPLPKAPEVDRPKRTRPKSKRPARHALLDGALGHFEGVRETDYGYLRPSKMLLLDVVASKSALSRALDAANELYLTLEDRGHPVSLAPRDVPLWRPDLDERERPDRERYRSAWRPSRATVVFIGTVAIGLTLFEYSENVEVRYTKDGYVRVTHEPVSKRRAADAFREWTSHRDLPSGRLCLRATSPYPNTKWERLWSEKSGENIVGRFPEIVRELEAAAEPIAKLAEQAETERQAELRKLEAEREAWMRKQAELERAREQQRLVENRNASREQVLAIAAAWDRAVRTDAFFQDAERRAERLDEPQRTEAVERLKHARELLGGVDALERFRAWKAPDER